MRPRPVRPGFSLIEMLVVIGLMGALMALSVASFVSTPRQQGLLGAEHLISDAVRQARLTARSQGAAVVLTLDQHHRDDRGLSRIVSVSRSFNLTEPDPTQILAGNAPGLAGLGFRVIKDTSGNPVLPAAITVEPRELPVRGGRVSGFRIACAFLAPPVSSAPISDYPLMLLGKTDDFATSTAGLVLSKVSRTMVNDVTAGDLSPRPPSTYITYELRGWLRTTTGILEVSTSERLQAPAGQTRVGEAAVMHLSLPAVDDSFDIATPINGGRWEQVALVFDGAHKLILERSGRRVAEFAAVGAVR